MHDTQFAWDDAVADPQSAAQIRREFSDWLGRHFTLDATGQRCGAGRQRGDGQCGGYAYVTASSRERCMLAGGYDGTAATLTVTVTDEGAWRNVDPATTELSRGRGIPLMRALSDHAIVDSSDAGTRVCLEWNRVTAARARA